ncbi:MurG-like transferase [Rubripirellula amarantea]|uniref:MurG-like transferase n=2 Tax=Rubripirellula amarantea TaxID=2527999 RepID=A0A5C5WJ47_9BACT|nr:MurG-like transferase [Rubripirellula amarantea]
MIAIGAELRRRGWDVVISLAQPYAHLATEAGLIPEPVITKSRFDELLANGNVWKPIRGARTMIGEVAAEFLDLHLEVINRNHLDGETVLVSHPLDLASRIFREVHPHTPLVDVHLAPSMLRTYDDPPRMSPFWWEVTRPSWLVKFAYRMVDAVAVDPVIKPIVNKTRSTYGLNPVSRIINDWWLSPDLILAMYPRWFAPATESFEPRLVHCGFPLQDIDVSDAALPESHSESHSKSQPRSHRPIVFTAGTAHRHTRPFFDRAIEVCQRLQHPGLLVSTHAENFPTDLPDLVSTSSYVSFAKLFPTASVVVHHGGAGTTSQCLASGVPQVIRPMAFDQFDHATRIESLGVGKWLRNDRKLTETIGSLLNDKATLARCREIATRVQGDTPITNAANRIERLIK